jgi:voltage-gated potassium channel
MSRYDRWVAATSRILDILAVIFLADILLNWLVTPGPPWWRPTLDVIAWTVWGAFAVDYLARLYLHPHRWEFFRTHMLDLLMVALPMLRLLRVGLVLRKAFRSVSTEQIASSLIAIVVAVVAAGAILEWRVEHLAPNANITTLGTAFWWAIVTTTTVGYGDTYPVTTAGRLIGSVIMVVGIGLIGTVSATIAAWFVTHKKQPKKRPAAGAPSADQPAGPPPIDTPPIDTPPIDTPAIDIATMDRTLAALNAQIDSLTVHQEQLRDLLGQLTAERDGRGKS